MWLFFNHEDTREWIYLLDNLVENINSSVNSSIGMASAQVNEKTSPLVFVKLYGHPVTLVKPKFRVGDAVHVFKYASCFTIPGKKTFKKGYQAIFAREVYHVTQVFRGEPNLFSIESQDSKPVMGQFYLRRGV